MKKALLIAFMMVLLAIVSTNQVVIAENQAQSVGDTGYLDGANAVADVDTGYTAQVDSDGNVHVAATEAITVLRKESSQDLSSAAMSYTTDFSDKVKVKHILFHASASISQSVTFSLDSKTGANYDTTLASEDLVSEQDYVYLADDLILEDGDEIVVTCTNSGSPAAVAYVTVIAEDLK